MSGATKNSEDAIMLEADKNSEVLAAISASIRELERLLISHMDKCERSFTNAEDLLERVDQTTVSLGMQVASIEEKIRQNASAYCVSCRPASPDVYSEPNLPLLNNKESANPSEDAANPWLRKREANEEPPSVSGWGSGVGW